MFNILNIFDFCWSLLDVNDIELVKDDEDNDYSIDSDCTQIGLPNII